MIRIAIIAASFASAASAAEIACRPGGVPQDAIELRESLIDDRLGFFGGERFKYAAALVPADWSAYGEVYEDAAGAACGFSENLRWRAQSPDGAVRVSLLPAEAWTVSARKAQFSSCESRNIRSATAYAQALLSGFGLTPLSAEDRPRSDIVAPYLAKMGEHTELSGARYEADAVERRFEIKGEEGLQDGLIFAAVSIVTPAPYIPEYELRATGWHAVLAVGPKETLDRDLLEAVRSSFFVNPQIQFYRAHAFGMHFQVNEGFVREREEYRRFPARAVSGPRTAACGQVFAALEIRNVWRSDDGRHWFSPALSGAMERKP